MTGPSDGDWRGLDATLTGRVLRPGSPNFHATSAPFNKRFTGTPAGVVSVANIADVRHTVDWARTNGVGIVPRGGGHSYAGFSVGPGLVMDLRGLNALSANGSTGLVTAAGGAAMAAVHAALRPHAMAFALGNGSDVGIGGLTLGGGSAAVSRKFGLTADALVRTEIVTADGQLLTCDAGENSDLFWACRGGGGGNFGVNVSFTFQARPVSDVSTCLLLWDRADAPKVLSVLQEIAAPDEFSVRLGVSTTGSDVVVSAVGLYLGPASELRQLLDPVLVVAKPVQEDIADRTYWEANDYLLHETSAGAFAARTNFATESLPDEAIATMLSWIDRWPGSANPDGGGFAMFGWGGEINRVAATDTAFIHRDASWLLSFDTSWADSDDAAVVDANLRWLSGMRDALSPYVSDGAYQNFIDPDLDDWRTAYYGVNYPRLVAIKQRVDPDRLFTFAQAIGS